MDDVWRPDRYEAFRRERRRPFDELLARLEPVPGGRVVDLGCGTGRLTAELHETLDSGSTLGVDRSPEMLRGAPHVPGLAFRVGDLRELAGEWDVIFSNAALHWLPSHDALFPELIGRLAPHGQIAIQVPAMFDHPAYRVAEELSREAPFREAWLEPIPSPSVLSPEAYATILHRAGLVDVWVALRIYLHELPGADAVVEWMRGARLTVYARRLPPELWDVFLETFRVRVRVRACLSSEGPQLFPFRRILMTGRRPGPGD